MYYLIERVTVRKDGKITIKAAESNVTPREYYMTTYKGSLADLLYDVNSGDLQLESTVDEKLITVSKEIDKIVQQELEGKGLTFEDALKYKQSSYFDIIKKVCEYFAANINREITKPLLMPIYYDVQRWVKDGIAELEVAKEQDKQNNIVKIWTAGKSIFEGYDLLVPYDNNEKFLLAPEEDYNNGGNLKYSDRVIDLGTEYSDLWSYLSFSGANRTGDEIEKAYPGRVDKIKKVVKLAEGKGLKIKPEVEPYKEFKIEVAKINGWLKTDEFQYRKQVKDYKGKPAFELIDASESEHGFIINEPKVIKLADYSEENISEVQKMYGADPEDPDNFVKDPGIIAEMLYEFGSIPVFGYDFVSEEEADMILVNYIYSGTLIDIEKEAVAV